MTKYYGAHISSIRKINDLLSLPATGKEQDWEFELADPDKLSEIFSYLFNDSDLCTEEKCTLTLLAISSLEELDLIAALKKEELID